MVFRSAVVSFFVLIAFSAIGPLCATISSNDDLLAELESLQMKSLSGVIHLDDRLISRFLNPEAIPRPYHLAIFFDAISLHSKSDLHLPQLRSEFAIVSESFAAHHRGLPSASKLFFCDIEFSESQPTFSSFGINTLPNIRLVSPFTQSLRESDSMDASAFSRLLESMAEFVESKTKLSVGPILRPPFVSPRQLTVLFLALLIASPFIIRKILSGKTPLHDSRFWMAGAVFVYFFSVSGSMHNIIRNMPMLITDRDGNLVFFYQGSGMQLGAEGFIVGSLYTLVGLGLAIVTHGLLRLKSVAVQRGMMFAAMVMAYWAVGKVISLDNWKTGYSIHAYWPTSWK